VPVSVHAQVLTTHDLTIIMAAKDAKDANTTVVKKSKWWHLQWYSDEDTPEERRFIIKLDLIVVPYAVLSYWVKYIDQSNLSMHQYLCVVR
jgi:hypothetical protein